MAMFSFSAPAFCYSSEPVSEKLAFSLNFVYPYRGYGIALVGFGLTMMITAAILYKIRSKKNALGTSLF